MEDVLDTHIRTELPLEEVETPLSTEIKADQTLDARGLLCPMPVLKASQAVKGMSSGQILEVLATDPASKPDLSAWSKTTGNEIIRVSEREGSPKVYVFYIRKK